MLAARAGGGRGMALLAAPRLRSPAGRTRNRAARAGGARGCSRRTAGGRKVPPTSGSGPGLQAHTSLQAETPAGAANAELLPQHPVRERAGGQAARPQGLLPQGLLRIGWRRGCEGGGRRAAHGRQAVDLIEEDDGRLRPLRLLRARRPRVTRPQARPPGGCAWKSRRSAASWLPARRPRSHCWLPPFTLRPHPGSLLDAESTLSHRIRVDHHWPSDSGPRAARRRARASKSRRSCCSASPTHLLSTSAPLRMKKATGRPCARPALAASARATSVLPVPAQGLLKPGCRRGRKSYVLQAQAALP